MTLANSFKSFLSKHEKSTARMVRMQNTLEINSKANHSKAGERALMKLFDVFVNMTWMVVELEQKNSLWFSLMVLQTSHQALQAKQEHSKIQDGFQ